MNEEQIEILRKLLDLIHRKVGIFQQGQLDEAMDAMLKAGEVVEEEVEEPPVLTQPGESQPVKEVNENGTN